MSTDDLFKRTGDEGYSQYLKCMISGPPKSGKTTLLGTVPGILVLDTEPNANNIDSIKHLNVPYATITNTDDLRHVAMVLGNDSLRQQLAQGKYGMQDIGAVAIDTLDTLQKLMKKERMKEQRSTQFLRDDWGWLKTEMEAIIEMFTALPMHVFFVVHTKTQEIGKGDDAYNIVLPGLEGSIAQSIAGMVGYSLLSYRKEELAADGTTYTKYWLQTEGDRTHDFLGTRTAGALPPVIEPNMKTIYDTVMANRPKVQAAPAPIVVQSPAQNPGQPEAVQTPVETPQSAPAEVPDAERPDDSEPITPAAMGHVKRVYDALEIGFPEEIVKERTIGEARTLVKYWRAIQQDHAEGKGQPGTSPQGEMLELMEAEGWIPDESEAVLASDPETASGKVDGTIEEVKAYATDLTRVQEAYDLEAVKDKPRSSLIAWLEDKGAKPAGTDAQPVQTPVENQPEVAEPPVTPEVAGVDTPASEDEAGGQAEREDSRDAEAVKAVEEGLGATEVVDENTPCEACGKPLDDLDLAELGKKRFGKLLCVDDYLAELKK